MFRFANPEMFYLLAALPLLVGIFVWGGRMRRERLARFGSAATIASLMPDASPRRVRNKFLIFLAAVALLVVALARPQIGSKLREVTREGIEIILAVDVSNSMLAQDFEPNRLERTKFAIHRLLDGLRGDNIGLIAFAGEAYVQLPVTADMAAARSFINRLSPDMIPRQGTAIGAAIDLASASFSPDSKGSRILIVISDGENHEDDPVAAAERAAAAGIKVYTIGIGTPAGVPIPVGNDFMKDSSGEIVVTKLDETTLEKIALAGEGAYIRSSNKSIGLDEIIDEVNKTEKRKMVSKIFDEYDEQYRYPLAAALVLLLAEFLMLGRKNKLLAKVNVFKQ